MAMALFVFDKSSSFTLQFSWNMAWWEFCKI